MKKLFLSLALLLQLLQVPLVAAATTDLDFTTTLKNLQESVTEQSVSVDPTGQGVTLPTFTDDTTEGAGVIVAAIQRFLDFFKLIVTPIAVLFLIIMGVLLWKLICKQSRR